MKLTLREMVLYAFCGTVCFFGQVVMAGLPNIEPVSLFVMLMAVCFGRKSIIAVYVFVLLEFLIYGFSLWNVFYLYVWAILFYAAWLLRRQTSVLPFAFLSALFGLSFGALCSLVYLLIGGWNTALSWWLAGLPFDAMHCIGNLVMTLLLFQPLRHLLSRYAKGQASS